MKKLFISIFAVLAVGAVAYLSGPKPASPTLSVDFPSVPQSLQSLQDSITNAEAAYGDSIKAFCQSEIFWCKELQSTDYVLLYLHGYTATKYEGMPVALDMAQRYGMNLYIPRLHDHGFVTSEPLLNMTADGLWESAKNALAVAECLGQKVIVMSTSTGGTLALYLSAMYPEKIHALINISPNILPTNFGVQLLSGPWGLQIARAVQGGNYIKTDSSSYHPREWSEGPRLESTVQLQCLLDATMKPSTFKAVKVPSLTLAYYKNEQEQDATVRVDKIREMHSLLGSEVKQYSELPTVGVHPMACGIISKDIDAVREVIFDFTEKTLKISPTDSTHISISEGEM